ncbi:MAG: 2-C-methyl-D-erythritol 4-phosphate cytidylyltransferase, partial [Clostridia bacterium]|nr:2-C-methyl-D-erythritol 4-phosphate cytidylyltransferase [Clostridia bacterium]
PIAGIPVLARTLINYQKADSIDDIFVITRAELFDKVAEFVKEYKITKFKACAEGGATRQHSVQNGISLCVDAAYVAIGDGARPFTKPEHIDAVSQSAIEHGGALLCVPAKDTIKVIGADGFVDSTPPRDTLMQAQTPQTFCKETFQQLMTQSISENQVVTDDASIFEIYGQKVFPVMGDYDNIKITTKEDIAMAETIAGKETV